MSNADSYTLEELQNNQRLVNRVQRLLAVILLTCLVIPLIGALNRILVGWQGEFLVPLMFLVALESMISHYRMRDVDIISSRLWYYRAAELVVLLVLSKLYLYLVHGVERLSEDLILWRQDFLEYFFNPEYMFTVALVVGIWLLSGELDAFFHQLGGDEELLMADVNSGFSEERSEIRQRFANLFIMLGGGMVVLTALISFDNQAAGAASPEFHRSVLAILGYFLAGLVLLSLTQLSILRTRWVIQHIYIERKITSRWVFFSIGLIFLVAFVALLLPTTYSRPVLQTLQYGFSLILALIQILAYLITLPFILLFSWLTRRFSNTTAPLKAPEMDFNPLPQRLPAEPWPWLEMVKTIVFWTLLVVFVAYAFIYYLREHPEYFGWIQRSEFWSRLRIVIKGVLDWLRGANRQIVQGIQSGLRRLLPSPDIKFNRSESGFLNPRRLSPRQQVQFYYLTLLRRSAEKGLPRSAAQTPSEYSQQLSEYLSLHAANSESGQTAQAFDMDGSSPSRQQLETEVAGVTEEFNEARYSRHEITNWQVSRVKSYWENILRALRKIT